MPRFAKEGGNKRKLVEEFPVLDLDRVIGPRRSLDPMGNDEVENKKRKIKLIELEKDKIRAEKDLEKVRSGGGGSSENSALSALVDVTKTAVEEAVKNKTPVVPPASGASEVAAVAKVAINALEKKGGEDEATRVDKVRDESHKREMNLTRELFNEKLEGRLGGIEGKIDSIGKGGGGLEVIKELQDVGVPISFGTGQMTDGQLKILQEIKAEGRRHAKEMKESDRRFQLMMRQLKQEDNFRWAHLQEERRRTNLLAGGLKRVGRSIARGMSEEEGEGKPEVKKHETPPIKLKKYTCEVCQAPIVVPPDKKPGDEVECGSCRSIFTLT